MSDVHYTPEERERIINQIVEILEQLGVIPTENESMEVDHHE